VLSEFNSKRLMVRDTDKGRELAAQVVDLHKLLTAYRHGLIKEHE
jgi:fructose-1,6-bisphosphatase-3